MSDHDHPTTDLADSHNLPTMIRGGLIANGYTENNKTFHKEDTSVEVKEDVVVIRKKRKPDKTIKHEEYIRILFRESAKYVCADPLIFMSLRFAIYFLNKWAIRIIFIILSFIVINKLTDSSQDSTSLTNAAFGILAVLASLSFSYAGRLKAEKEINDCVYCGESFMFASILCIVASVIKYAGSSIDLFGKNSYHILVLTQDYLKTTICILSWLVFCFALVSAHNGLETLHKMFMKKTHLKELGKLL